MTLKQMDAYYMANATDAPGMGIELDRNTNGTQRIQGYMSNEVRPNYKFSNLPDGVSLQFADREPRFYASVAYNGAIWNLLNASKDLDETPNIQVFYYRGTKDGYQPSHDGWLATGIGIKKYVNPYDIVGAHVDLSRIKRNTIQPCVMPRYSLSMPKL